MILAFQKRIALPGFNSDLLTEEHQTTIEQFFLSSEHPLLTTHMPDAQHVVLQHLPPTDATEFCYFVRLDSEPLTPAAFESRVQYGYLKMGALDSLSRHMGAVFSPLLSRNAPAWPVSVQNEFAAGMNRFMAALNDETHRALGHTVLFIPHEDLTRDPAQLCLEKELVQRLEATMIHWTRQVKEVLSSNQSDPGAAAIELPTQEIDFWKHRRDNISGIATQLDTPAVLRVREVLVAAKSLYVTQFDTIGSRIKEGMVQADSNYRFLSPLRDCMTTLSKSELKDMAALFPKLIDHVRIIWTNSPHFNTRDQITGLFQKISNAVVMRCREGASLDEVFSGNVFTAISTLKDAISACESWQSTYSFKKEVHEAHSDKPWQISHSSIFAQVDAFVQRCKNLLEVCEGQIHFGRKEGAGTRPLPCLGGSKGSEVQASLQGIEQLFQASLVPLLEIRASILDVKNPLWLTCFSKFRATTRDLEVMIQNVINSTLSAVRTIESVIELLDVFQMLSGRELIGRTLTKCTERAYELFGEQLDAVKRVFNNLRTNPPLGPMWPKLAGAGLWARLLKKQIDHNKDILSKAAFLSPNAPGDEVMEHYRVLSNALTDYITKSYNNWALNAQVDSAKLLSVALMRRAANRSQLELNFDLSLLRLFTEIQFWEKLMFEIPHTALEAYHKREELRSLREHVMLVVRDYARVVDMLSVEERNLFRERIRFLDKKVQPGLTKLTWASKGISEYYVADCRMHASKLKDIVDQYMDANQRIAALCKQMSDALVLRIESKHTCTPAELAATLDDQRVQAEEQLVGFHKDIISVMRKMFEVFRNDGMEVQQHWRKYTTNIDKMVEDSLRMNVKKSLQELFKAVNGDGKSAPTPLVKISVVLDGQRVQFEPSYDSIVQLTVRLAATVPASLDRLPRLPTVLAKGAVVEAGFRATIEADDEIKKLKQLIVHGLQSNAPNLQAYVTTWSDKYHEIWETNKETFIAKYQSYNPPLSKFDADIARYGEVANNVQKEETLVAINFILLDCSLLKLSIVDHCDVWQSKFTQLLYTMTCTQLRGIYAYLADTEARLKRTPTTLDEMVASIEAFNEAQASLPATERRFLPLQEQFAILERYEVEIADDIFGLVEGLSDEWAKFQGTIQECEQMLASSRKKFKAELLQSTDDLNRNAGLLRDSLLKSGPYTSAVPAATALQAVSEFKQQLQVLKDQEVSLRSGLKVFQIQQTLPKDMLDMEKDIVLLEQVWALAHEWQQLYGGWSGCVFQSIETEKMEREAQGILKKVVKVVRDVKDKDWEIATHVRNKIEQFKRLMPLIQDLKNPALRPRHWKQLVDEVNRPFDPTGPDFTLGVMIDLGLDQFGELIGNISGAASKELSIEQSLQTIEGVWGSTKLEIVAFKDRGHYILRGTDEVYQLLEDNQVTLATMKASRFVKPFETDVDHWERTLSLILEVVEMLLTVQRQWMYLENIFLGEDIRKQLPAETTHFDEVNDAWRKIMTRLFADPNAQRGTHTAGLLKTLTDMNAVLEQIQKSLDMYLETKRQIFPRFYFVSNDDLLEILGQSRNPQAVQPHLLKCFDNIKSLDLQVGGPSNKKQNEATGMRSADGEQVKFDNTVVLDGPVEGWLCLVEDEMRRTLRKQMGECRVAHKKQKKDKWITEWPGQLVLTVSQMVWTAECTKGLTGTKGDKSVRRGLKSIMKKQVSLLNKLTDNVRSVTNKVTRKKLVALITVEVHSRDVIERLAKVPGIDQNSFEWLMQLRFYWEAEAGPGGDCVSRQTNTRFLYGYEYLGNSGRLVITPLTDRCYMTLTTALHLHRGGSPKGPAGTGKTETVKDLGKALGDYVIVVNCSEGLDYKSLGRMFSGLAQTGAWGCFDEFNRINIEVLSVVAQQILSILSAQMVLNPDRKETRFVFEGAEIRLLWSCGVFITMNPGYAGRTELPDNLKSMFRPISMMVPDSAMIAEIILYGQGFNNTRILAKKVHTLYKLAVQQLSKQDHYDFGLRALVSVLLNAGRKRQAMPDTPQEEVLVLAMKDMNVAKMTADDLPLFLAIMSDLFPGVEPQEVDYGTLRGAIEDDLKENKLQVTEVIVKKTLQLYETKNTRHSVMIVGATGSGKSVAWRTLQRVLSKLNKQGQAYPAVRDFPINPKALSLAELYGEFNITTNEWHDGVLSSVMRMACADEKPDQKWLVFDGPVDTLWIESMNSVMDDNKILTLVNGERISMPEPVSLLFEVEDLSVASPATVSRCGMVFHDAKDLGWRPFVNSWLSRFENDAPTLELLRRLFDRYVEKLLEFVSTKCSELIRTTPLNRVTSLCNLLDAVLTETNGFTKSDGEDAFRRTAELWFLFACIWSLCATVDEEGRKRVDNYLREIEGQFPSKDSVYEYYVDPRTRSWVHWEQELRFGWRYTPGVPFYKIQVPTVDTVRYDFLLYNLTITKKPALMVGPVGTGKTSVVQAMLQRLDASKYSVLNINMSSKTSSNNVQEIIESKVEKRTKGVFVPVGGKRMVMFMDDLNMPARDTFGSQPPLELLRQWMEYGFWYDREKQVVKHVRDMQVVGAMGPPGGGRMEISRRLQSRFNIVNMTFPSDTQIRRIFGSMITQKLQEFEESVKSIADRMTQATIDVYQHVCARMLPTPSKIHYLFNLRDISRVFQGLLRAHKDFHDTRDGMTRLWVHECFRVFCDRLVGEKDIADFTKLVEDKLHEAFDVSFSTLCPQRSVPIFVDFTREGVTVPVYEDMGADTKRLKKALDDKLEDYNNSPFVPMNLVLFRDAMEHVARIVRVTRLDRGNMLLIGVGGSGRQSLTRLAAFVLDYHVFQIEVTRHYRLGEFRDDLKKLYRQAGVDNKTTLFLFTDTQIVMEDFLEDINNILSSGEVPNLFEPEELEEIRGNLTPFARAAGIEDNADSMFKFFIERVRNNLHVVLCMSPVGEAFRNRIRMYPGLVNCTTIDYFSAWPQDALMAVAQKYLEDVAFGSDAQQSDVIRAALSKTFTVVQQSVVTTSQRMLQELKRYNYVTPTNYLELVTGYKDLLAEKRKELGDAADKLANGLGKLDDTRAKVQVMSVELEDTKKKLQQFQQECDEYLVVIVQQKREADEQQKAVSARSEKIGVEAAACAEMEVAARADLEEALPALEAAMEALKSLNKTDITEIKSYTKPPALVEMVLEAVMILRKGKPDWAEAKKQLSEVNFIKQLIEFDKDNMGDKVLKKIAQYVAKSEFQPDIVGRVSLAARSLCMWVRAMDVYGRVYKVVEPKRLALKEAQDTLAAKQSTLASAKEKLREVTERVERLQADYEGKLRTKEELRQKAELTSLRLERAAKLVSGLAGERTRWEASIKTLRASIEFLPGDCLLAAAFMSYMGPFTAEYREQLLRKTWLPQVRAEQLPCDPSFSMSHFLAKPTDVRFWNIQGLPSDSFSTENGVVVTRGRRWPLMIDPQGQASKWIKNMERGRKLKVIDLQQADYLRTLENAIQFGTPVLLQNVGEELDPSLAPILNRSIVKVGGREIIRLGDKEVEYNREFKFYITTKMRNPHYTPEISTKTSIVNFAVVEQGLEAQLLGIVVRRERPELEEQKDTLVLNIAAGKKKLAELEDKILYLLSTAQGSLLDDEALVETLNSSKVTSAEVLEQLAVAEITEAQIDVAREAYRPSAKRASILFFVLNDISKIDPMYQFSLDAYIGLFNISISKSVKLANLDARIESINEYHTYATYRYTCRGLFERHKLLFSFHMNAKILEAANKLNIQEYSFFLRGGQVLDRSLQVPNPAAEWISARAWDNITELDRTLPKFQGLANSMEQRVREWHQWYVSARPEETHLPGEWENACNEMQRMLIVGSLRPDRVSIVATTFVVNNLAARFVEPPPLDMNAVLADSTCSSPLIFVLSPGVDPTKMLLDFADKKGMGKKFHSLSLGQGQAPVAERLIKDGVKHGHWVFLANCHLSLSWMPALSKIVEMFEVDKPHEDFRLWLSSSPDPRFPIAILQAGIKMTTEPPKGIRANMKRLYTLVSEETFEVCQAASKYKRLMFCLSFFHSILLERRKFQMLGWNVIYPFNDSDFEVSENLLRIYLDEYAETPWEALKYLVAGVNYGGHVTDDLDRRLLMTYITDMFTEEALTTDGFKPSMSDKYRIPTDGPLQHYKDSVSTLPLVDPPEAFGQHPNADISSMIKETRTLLDTLIAMQPATASTTGGTQEEKVLEMAADFLNRIPPNIDYAATAKLLADEPSPLNIVLLQEIARYNKLLDKIRRSLGDLQKGIQGLVVMSSDLEQTFNCIFNGVVPPIWTGTFPSQKPLASWVRDLVERVDFFAQWALTGRPPLIFWISAFTFPSGFLTAVLQMAARNNGVSIDTLAWEFPVMTLDDVNIIEQPKDGVYVRGLYLEGAGWDRKNAMLVEPQPMELVCGMPTIHFKPVDVKKVAKKGYYSCPCYYYPNRAGEGGALAWSFVISVDLKVGAVSPDHYIRRGTALLMSLDM